MATTAASADRAEEDARPLISPALTSIAAGVLLTILIARMAWDAGGFFPESYLSTGALALAACAILLAASRPGFLVSSDALMAVAGLGGLALWTGLSSLWSSSPAEALDGMQRDLMYLGLFGLATLAAGSGRYSRHLVWIAFGLTVVIVFGGLLSRLLPDVFHGEEATQASSRLAYPLTYSNAFGGLAALGAVLACGLAADPRLVWWLRATAATLSVPLVVAMALSASRGSWVALFVGIVVLGLLSAHRASLLLTGAIIGVGWALALARLGSYDALTDAPGLGAGRVHEGGVFLIQLVLIAAAVGGASGLLGVARTSPRTMERLDRAFRPIVLGVALVAVVVGAGAYASRGDAVEGRSAGSLERVGNWIDRQWDEFMAPAGTIDPVTGSARVTAGAGGSRSDVYRVAMDAFKGSPLGGDGAGSFRVHWLAERPIREGVVNAHSLEIETLAELGIVGAALLLAFLGAIVSATLRARLKPGALSRSQVAATGAACSVWIVHSAVDWDWQIPGFTAVFLLLACSMLPYGKRRRRRRRRSVSAPSGA